MRKHWAVILGVLGLAFAYGAPVEAQISTCSGGTFTVTTLADGVAMANGYNNPACDLVINTSIVPAIQDFKLIAKSLTVQGPDVNDPGAGRVNIVNNVNNDADFTIETTGNIKFDEAILKTRDLFKITCKGPGCTFTSTNAELIASSTLAFGGPGGSLLVTSDGPLSVTKTTAYGGNFLILTSKNSNLTFLCRPEEGGCKDPTRTNGPIDTLICDGTANTARQQFALGQPCQITFTDAAALKEVCIQAPGVNCGGGGIETHLIADGDIDITGSTILGQNTFLMISYHGRLLASNSVLTGSRFNVTINGVNNNVSADMTGAEWDASDFIRVTVKTCQAVASGPCIAADDSKLTAEITSGFPAINNDTNPFNAPGSPGNPNYTPNVKDSSGECAPATAVVPNKGNIQLKAANATGLVTLCGATLN
jgi:hypothetical protein